jgi:hypothetical protein
MKKIQLSGKLVLKDGSVFYGILFGSEVSTNKDKNKEVIIDGKDKGN